MKDKLALIAVFKKEVADASAESLLDSLQVKYRSGMDSSRGKLYFYSTGPKFILTFETEEDKERIHKALAAVEELHEVYEPDWDKCKD